MDKKDKILFSRISEACEHNYAPQFFGFFDEGQQAKLIPILNRCGEPYRFWGGFENAGRKLLCIFPDYVSEDEIEWPMSAVRFEIDFPLNHRNILGEILSYGITRECVGDINLTESEVQIIFQTHMLRLFEENLKSINRHPVKPIFTGYNDIKAFSLKFKSLDIVAASERLDCVIGKIWGLSRKDAVTAIHQGRLKLNYSEMSKTDTKLKAGDIISLKGKGKARIKSLDGQTKKGNLRIQVEKYV